jgi:exosortase C (VPDSG-CTERM-specific)
MEEKAAMQQFKIATGILLALFALPLLRLFQFAWGDELHSYIVIIPVVTAYLISLRKKNLPPLSVASKIPAAFFFLAGLAVAAWHWRSPGVPPADNLAQSTLAFLLLLGGVMFWFLGAARVRGMLFPLSLLVFMIPLPVAARDGLEMFLQHGSAMVASWMFALSGLPVFQTGLDFKLPGITLHVAPECSGIHSTLVLFITSLVAANLFLRGGGRRAVLCLAVIPLALVRNAFRIFVISELCVHVGPHMIDSPIHHHGGPLFFGLSLLPFGLLLYWLRKSERRAEKKASDVVDQKY